MKTKVFLFAAVLLAAVFLLCACGDAAVEQKTADLMEAIKAGDAASVYAMMYPDVCTEDDVKGSVEMVLERYPLSEGYEMKQQGFEVNNSILPKQKTVNLKYLVKTGGEEFVLDVMYWETKDASGFASVNFNFGT